MPNHDLRRSPNNEPVCLCGYRPEILDTIMLAPADVVHVKARTAVLDHAEALNKFVAIVDALAQAVTLEEAEAQMVSRSAEPTPLRSPDAPFVVRDARYPRAGVRQTSDGRWKLSCWDGDQIVHVVDDPVFMEREAACEVGRIIIGAHRESGTSLNGLAA